MNSLAPVSVASLANDKKGKEQGKHGAYLNRTDAHLLLLGSASLGVLHHSPKEHWEVQAGGS